MSVPFEFQLKWRVQKGTGKTGKEIRGVYDPIRGRYVYPESGKSPLALQDFVVDRAAHKERDIKMQMKRERKGDKLHDPKQAQALEMQQQLSGQGSVTTPGKQQGISRETQEHISDLQDQAKEAVEQAGNLQGLDIKELGLIPEFEDVGPDTKKQSGRTESVSAKKDEEDVESTKKDKEKKETSAKKKVGKIEEELAEESTAKSIIAMYLDNASL